MTKKLDSYEDFDDQNYCYFEKNKFNKKLHDSKVNDRDEIYKSRNNYKRAAAKIMAKKQLYNTDLYL